MIFTLKGNQDEIALFPSELGTRLDDEIVMGYSYKVSLLGHNPVEKASVITVDGAYSLGFAFEDDIEFPDSHYVYIKADSSILFLHNSHLWVNPAITEALLKRKELEAE